jgi:hypothetical protein
VSNEYTSSLTLLYDPNHLTFQILNWKESFTLGFFRIEIFFIWVSFQSLLCWIAALATNLPIVIGSRLVSASVLELIANANAIAFGILSAVGIGICVYFLKSVDEENFKSSKN